MPAEKPRGRIQDAVWQRVRELSLTPMSEALQRAHKKTEEAVSFTYWLSDHCADFSAVRVFLDELKSDLIGVLFASTIGLERTAYLHARSALENLIRHCFYDGRPAMLVSEQLQLPGTTTRRTWAELSKEIRLLPPFAPASITQDAQKDKQGAPLTEEKSRKRHGEQTGTPPLFEDLDLLYAEACRYVHAPTTPDVRSNIRGIRLAGGMSEERAAQLAEFLWRLCDVSVLLLALYHLGPYLLISQPIRAYLMKAMRPEGRKRFLACLDKVSLGWARHQRDAALVTLRDRRRKVKLGREGLRAEGGRLVIVTPDCRPDRG